MAFTINPNPKKKYVCDLPTCGNIVIRNIKKASAYKHTYCSQSCRSKHMVILGQGKVRNRAKKTIVDLKKTKNKLTQLPKFKTKEIDLTNGKWVRLDSKTLVFRKNNFVII